MSADAERWDSRYGAGVAPQTVQPPEVVATHLGDLSTGAAVLDVACGWGDAGLFLAQRGATVTFADVSSVALDAVADRAQTLGLRNTTTLTIDLSVGPVPIDLSVGPVPIGPWDAIVCTHYLDRQLLPRLGGALAPGGRLVCAIATTTNLERHERPSARFLLEPGELSTLVPDLDILHSSDAWRANGVHEAWLVASTT